MHGTGIRIPWPRRIAWGFTLFLAVTFSQAVPTEPPVAPESAREAPMLARLVNEGKLPPLARRLPEHPMVVPLQQRPGVYGGTWRMYHLDTGLIFPRLIASYYPLARWSPDAAHLIPGVAESWDYSPDGRIVTFHLRKGLKWSDGEPFTSADIRFWWELCLDARVLGMGERLLFTPPEWAYADGKLMTLETPDPWTIRFCYATPFYLVPNFMATGFWVPEETLIPAHYLKRFHPDFAPQHKDFQEMLRKNNPANNPERPTLGPWRLASLSETGDRAIFERNPYYYGVDPEGRQLPYIDHIESIRVQNVESGLLMIMGGDIDAQFFGIPQTDYTLLERFAQRHAYRIMRWEEGTAAWYSVCINWSPEEGARRHLFRNKLFRRALSVAIDRHRLNQISWAGLGRPQAGAITDESWHFQSPEGQALLKRWITEWSQHDPALANRYLDQCGLDQRDGEGFRLLEGQPFKIRLEYFDDPVASDQALLMAEDWQRVGVRTSTRRAVGSDLWTRVRLGKFDMYLQHNSELDLFSFPAWVFPTNNIYWHPTIGRWYMTGGKEGEKPEGCMARLLDLYDECKRTPDIEARHRRVLDAVRVHLDEGPFFLGTCGRQPDLVVVKDHFHNVPPTGILGPKAICQPGSQFPEQFFIDPPAGGR